MIKRLGWRGPLWAAAGRGRALSYGLENSSSLSALARQPGAASRASRKPVGQADLGGAEVENHGRIAGAESVQGQRHGERAGESDEVADSHGGDAGILAALRSEEHT